jgi:hypothetical protein
MSDLGGCSFLYFYCGDQSQLQKDPFIDNAAWAIRSTYHTVLKTSPGAAIFGRDMLLDIPFVAWKQIGDYRQNQTDRSNKREK